MYKSTDEYFVTQLHVPRDIFEMFHVIQLYLLAGSWPVGNETILKKKRIWRIPVFPFNHISNDFDSRFSESQPIYINLIRNPLDRKVSGYYFIRFEEGHIKSMSDIKRNMVREVYGSYSRACETSAGYLRSIYPSLGMRQLGDVTMGQWRHN